MEILNKDKTIGINGNNFDLPKRKADLCRWEYREWKEARSQFREIWLDSYVTSDDNREKHIESCTLLSKNNSYFLDDKKLTNKEDIEKAEYVFRFIEGKE